MKVLLIMADANMHKFWIFGRLKSAREAPLTLTTLAAIGGEVPDVEFRLVDESVDTVPLDYPADLVGISVLTGTARRAYALTELSPDKSWGLAYGQGLEDYTLNDGRVFAIPTRWTAVVAKEDDGKWRIRSMHIGTNFLDNPLINTVENAVRQYAIGAGVIGVLVGLALGFVIGRRRR